MLTQVRNQFRSFQFLTMISFASLVLVLVLAQPALAQEAEGDGGGGAEAAGDSGAGGVGGDVVENKLNVEIKKINGEVSSVSIRGPNGVGNTKVFPLEQKNNIGR